MIYIRDIYQANPGQTTRKCVYLDRRGYVRSRDKDGGHIIRSAIAQNPMLHANFAALSSIQAELLPSEVLHCANGKFRAFLLP